MDFRGLCVRWAYNRFINRQKTCAIGKRRLMKKEVKDIRYNVRMTKQTFDIVDSF